jgi:hypothetical protein
VISGSGRSTTLDYSSSILCASAMDDTARDMAVVMPSNPKKVLLAPPAVGFEQ